MQKSQVSKIQKIKKLFGRDDLTSYFENIVIFFIELYVHDLNNINNNQFSSRQQQEEFFRNVSDEKYHTNVVTEMNKAIISSKLFYEQFRNFILSTIYKNSRVSRINLQNKNQYTSVEKKNIYDHLIPDLKDYILLYKEEEETSNFLNSMKELVIKCNILFSQRRYPKYMLPFLCQKLINGTLDVPLPWDKYQQFKKQIKFKIKIVDSEATYDKI